MPTALPDGLERSCAPGNWLEQRASGDWLEHRAPVDGIELLRAQFAGPGYAPHRHDGYAIGVTDFGVQTFDYRGAVERRLAGQVVVLHPDEVHDGRAGDERGFGYHLVYVEPARISDALSALTGRPTPLPFVPPHITDHPTLTRAVDRAFLDPPEPLALDALVFQLADGLLNAAGSRLARQRNLDHAALDRARAFLDAERSIVRSADLEAVSGLSRFELARQFRARFGTSPYRYSLVRRLDLARRALQQHTSLADVALDAGFADQAHFSRAFKAAYGLPPGRYLALSSR